MSSPNMRRSIPTQSYGMNTMPGSRRTSCIDPSDHPELLDERYRQLEATRQQEIQRGVGLCAHLNRHGCGLGVSRSQYGLCSACSFFCTHSEHDPRTANTDTTNMTYEEIAQLELALARRVMFCEAEPQPRGPTYADAMAAAAGIAELAERQAAAHARRDEEYRRRQRSNQEQENNEQNTRDAEMHDATEAGPSRGPGLQRGPSQRGHVNKNIGPRPSAVNSQQAGTQQKQQRDRYIQRSEAEMMLDPEILAYLNAVSRVPPQPHPLPPAILAAQARAEHEVMLRRNMEAEQARQREQIELQKQQERNRQREQDREQYHAELARQRQRQLQKQQEEDARIEATQGDLTEEERSERRKKRREEREEQARQQLLRLQQAGREHVQQQQEKLQRERVQRQQQMLQRQQEQEARAKEENTEEKEEKQPGQAMEPEQQPEQQQQVQALPARQPLPVATRSD